MTAETLIRLTERGKWHAVPYGDSYNETRTLCGRSFCPNQIERRKFEEVEILWNWRYDPFSVVCTKCSDKALSP